MPYTFHCNWMLVQCSEGRVDKVLVTDSTLGGNDSSVYTSFHGDLATMQLVELGKSREVGCGTMLILSR